MKAAILVEQNKPLEMWELELPELKYGQVQVKVMASSICGAQVNEILGAAGPDKYLPHLLGHEGAGVVEKIGPGVTHVAEGDIVVMHWRKGVGIDAEPPKYLSTEYGIEVGAGPVATFTDKAIVSENRLTPTTKRIGFKQLALLGCGVTTGLGLINNEARVKIGQSVLVIGCGGVGLSVIQGARLAGANPIIGVDVCQNKLRLAKKLGADFKFPPTIFEDHVKSACPDGVDVVVDCTGLPDMINKGHHLTAAGGKTILVGQPQAGRSLIFENARELYKGKTLMDSQGGLTDPTRDIPRYIDLYCAGKLMLDELITISFGLKFVNNAFAHLEKGCEGRVMLEMYNGQC